MNTIPLVSHPRHMTESELREYFPDALALAWIGECACGAECIQRYGDVKRNMDGTVHVCIEPRKIGPEPIPSQSPAARKIGVAGL